MAAPLRSRVDPGSGHDADVAAAPGALLVEQVRLDRQAYVLGASSQPDL